MTNPFTQIVVLPSTYTEGFKKVCDEQFKQGQDLMNNYFKEGYRIKLVTSATLVSGNDSAIYTTYVFEKETV